MEVEEVTTATPQSGDMTFVRQSIRRAMYRIEVSVPWAGLQEGNHYFLSRRQSAA